MAPPYSSLLQNTSHKKRLLIAAISVLWLLSLWRAIAVLGPDSDHVYFNSDGAIPLLMANDQRPITVFDHYYYAAGRWGAWPMLTARLINHSVKYRWTAYSLHFVRSVWLFLGIIVLALLNRRAAFFVVLICIMLICLPYIIRLRLFDLSQVYSWQITALLLGWYSLRRLFGEELTLSNGKVFLAKRVLWCFLVYWFSFLAIWSSFASGPFLCFLVGLEAARSRLMSGKPPIRSWRTTRYLWGFALVFAAIAAEILMRINYHRHSQKHYGNEYKSLMSIDRGYLLHNLNVQVGILNHFRLWPLILVTLVAILAVGVIIVYSKLKRREQHVAKLRSLLLEDTGIMIVGTFGLAVINFVLIVLVNHVRLNLYDNRFSTVTFLFGSMSGLLTLYLLLSAVFSKARISRYGIPALMLAGILFLFVKFPGPYPSGLYLAEQETAIALTKKLPRACLMGSYWSTYVFSALQPTDTLVPLPMEGEFVRMPWTIKMLREEKYVLVEYRRVRREIPEQLIQYGNSLQLVESHFYENGPYEFALYLNTSN